MRLNNELRVERARQNISQTDMAKHLGVSRQTIYSIENQKFVPSVELALRIAELLNVPLEKIFWLED